MQVKGKVVRDDLGPGVFLLETSDGRRFALKGGDDALRREGQTVEVEGTLATDAVGIGMTGDPVLDVARYEVLD